MMIVSAGLVNGDLAPGEVTSFIVREGFEPGITKIGPGRYQLRLSPLASTSELRGVVVVTPAIDGAIGQATLLPGNLVDVAFRDAAGDPREADFNIIVTRISPGPG